MSRHYYTDAERALIRRHYPHRYTREVAAMIGVSERCIYSLASTMGLKKSPAFLKRELARQGERLRRVGARSRFEPGRPSWNAGKKGWCAPGCERTWFKKGFFPYNRDPEFYVLGALKVSDDGYIVMRTSFKPGASGWSLLHRVLWEDAHGPVPRGYCLAFKDGEPLNVCLENLELITRAELMRRNTIHNLPQPLKEVVQLRGALKRRIRGIEHRTTA